MWHNDVSFWGCAAFFGSPLLSNDQHLPSRRLFPAIQKYRTKSVRTRVQTMERINNPKRKTRTHQKVELPKILPSSPVGESELLFREPLQSEKCSFPPSARGHSTKNCTIGGRLTKTTEQWNDSSNRWLVKTKLSYFITFCSVSTKKNSSS